MRHHSDRDFEKLEKTQDDIQKHVENTDKNVLDNKEQLLKIETIAECFMWIGGFVGFGGLAAFIRKKGDSA
jgi:hypothetical protein